MYARFFRWASDRLDVNGIIAFVSNNSFIDARTFDGFRKVLAREFHEIRIVDLKGNARTSGERRRQEGGNVFDDQIRVGVAVWFCVKKKDAHGCQIFYEAVRDYAKSGEKRQFLAGRALRERISEEIRPDVAGNWLNLAHNDFEDLLPLVDRSSESKAVFGLTTNGVNTARDDWVYDFDAELLTARVAFATVEFNREVSKWRGSSKVDREQLSKAVKWSEGLLANLRRAPAPEVARDKIVAAHYRPFVSQSYYSEPIFSDRLTGNHYELFGASLGSTTRCIAISAPGNAATFRLLASDRLADWHYMGDTRLYGAYRFSADGQRHDNITDWALKQFTSHYKAGPGKRLPEPSKKGIFHYVYAVLHDPMYRDKYAQNLKREFPRVPLYGLLRADFWRWADWGRALMDLHIGYETVESWPLQRTDTPDEKARTAGQAPKCMLKSEPEAGRIVIDSETVLSGVPPQAWTYRLGNRSAIDWVLDQHKERKPKDPTIREKFDTYRFADHKERVIDLLARVVRVSVDTLRIVDALRTGPR